MLVYLIIFTQAFLKIDSLEIPLYCKDRIIQVPVEPPAPQVLVYVPRSRARLASFERPPAPFRPQPDVNGHLEVEEREARVGDCFERERGQWISARDTCFADKGMRVM